MQLIRKNIRMSVSFLVLVLQVDSRCVNTCRLVELPVRLYRDVSIARACYARIRRIPDRSNRSWVILQSVGSNKAHNFEHTFGMLFWSSTPHTGSTWKQNWRRRWVPSTSYKTRIRYTGNHAVDECTGINLMIWIEEETNRDRYSGWD